VEGVVVRSTAQQSLIEQAQRHRELSVTSWISYHAFACAESHMFQIDCCLVCGSNGDQQDFLCCADCGEAMHFYCIGLPDITVPRRDPWQWRCPNCAVCLHCGLADEPEELLVCDVCDNVQHLRCFDPPLKQVPEAAWRCDRCVICRCCGSTAPDGLDANGVALFNPNSGAQVRCFVFAFLR
jgi:hypothetical protein